jgi:hypothetical protein
MRSSCRWASRGPSKRSQRRCALPHSKRKLEAVPLYRTPQDVINLLQELLARAENDEILALGVVVICPEDQIEVLDVGTQVGHRHRMVAGALYLQDQVKKE